MVGDPSEGDLSQRQTFSVRHLNVRRFQKWISRVEWKKGEEACDD